MQTPATTDFRPTFPGTLAILICAAIGYLLSFSDGSASQVATRVGYTWIAGIGLSFLFDLRLGIRNLIRVDAFALVALYFFTFFEFVFPQPEFDMLVIPDDVVRAIHYMQIGLAALAIGRHIKIGPQHGLDFIGKVEMRKQDFLTIYFGAFFLCHLYMWMAVGFNPLTWWEELLSPRFGRAWGRGRYGDLSTLLNELQLLGYVMPPIAGVIFARWKEYGKLTLVLVGAALLVLWFVAFSSGTRNILGIQMAGFLGGLLIVQRQLKIWKIVLAGGLIGGVFVYLAGHMLDFRNMGLQRYVEEGYYTRDYKEFAKSYIAEEEQIERSYFVDYNLWRIAQMVAVFPTVYEYNGWNLPFVAITKPIPRAFWPGKPTDLNTGLEEAIGAEGYTIACTWVGEAYVAGGLPWIVAIGLLIGSFCRFWNQLGRFMTAAFPLIVFASGIYAVLLLMRSLMFFTTALLPSIALIVLGTFLYNSRRNSDGAY